MKRADQSDRGDRNAPAEAVALEYRKHSGGAPRIVAKGRGELAERIMDLARENGVPLETDADLVSLLGACEVGEEIPDELYVVVAELLRYLYALNGELGSD